MRGKKAKEIRKKSPAPPDPNRVVLRMQILVSADGRINVKNFPANEAATRAIMASAMNRLDAYYKRKAQGPK